MILTRAGALSLGAASLWLGLLLGALALILIRVVPGLNPAGRYRIWYTTLGLMLLLPLATLGRFPGEGSAQPSAVMVSRHSPTAVPSVSGPSPPGATRPGVPAEPESAGAGREPREWGWRLQAPGRVLDWLLWIWLAGLGFGTARLALEAWRLARLRRQARPPSRDLLQIWSQSIRAVPTGRTLRLLVSDHVWVPMACGWFRPAVVLPSRIDRMLTLEETRHLLMHELAHLARRDDWHQMVCQLAGVICWWHPLIQWVIGRLEAEGEFACDEAVAERTGRRPYARTLVRVAGLALDRASALAPAASRGQLSERVESLVGGAASTTLPAWRRSLAGATLGSLIAAGIWLGPPEIGVREAPGAPAGRPLSGPVPETVGGELDRIFSRFADSGFSGTILVAVGDRVVLEKGYGWADRERQIPATAATRYSTAGITKLFTAAAILTLEEEGRVTRYDTLARWTGPLPGAKQGVTLHQLLTHTDGLTRLQAPVYRQSADDFVAAVAATPAAFAPGTGYRYNDFGHSLLGLVVERASGERYEDFIRHRFLKPAGMAATGFEGEAGPVAVEYAGQAGRQVAIPKRAYLWGRRGSLGMISTAGDLHQWFRAMSDPRVLSPRVRERMLTPMEQSDWGAEQGYGWDFQPRPGGHRLWRRVAGTPGFEGELLHDPVGGWTAVILVNSRVGWRFRVWEAIERTIGFS